MPKFRYAKPATIKFKVIFQLPSCGSPIAVTSGFIAGTGPVVDLAGQVDIEMVDPVQCGDASLHGVVKHLSC